MKKKAERTRIERETRGKGSIYAILQPFHTPTMNELVGKRIDVLHLFEVTLPGSARKEVHKRWCQGQVIRVTHAEDKPQPTVRVLWDPMPDVDGGENSTQSDQVLMPREWKKDCDYAWRIDIDIEIATENDDDEAVIAERDYDESENHADDTDTDSSESESD